MLFGRPVVAKEAGLFGGRFDFACVSDVGLFARHLLCDRFTIFFLLIRRPLHINPPLATLLGVAHLLVLFLSQLHVQMLCVDFDKLKL